MSDQKEEPIETLANGAKQSDIGVRCDLLPAKALLAVARVLHRGAIKYGENNWRGIPVEAHVNHGLAHWLKFLAGDRNDDHPANAACRALMALEQHIEEQEKKQREREQRERDLEDQMLKAFRLASKPKPTEPVLERVEVGDAMGEAPDFVVASQTPAMEPVQCEIVELEDDNDCIFYAIKRLDDGRFRCGFYASSWAKKSSDAMRFDSDAHARDCFAKFVKPLRFALADEPVQCRVVRHKDDRRPDKWVIERMDTGELHLVGRSWTRDIEAAWGFYHPDAARNFVRKYFIPCGFALADDAPTPPEGGDK